MKKYNHLALEKKWQKEWEKKGLYKATNPKKATGVSSTEKLPPKCYVLDMFPYPSGQGLHVGHPRGYIASDIFARFKRMQGYNVLHPMGYDAFGLPAEQYAIQNNIHPRKAVLKNVATYKKQLEGIGFSFDWSREINTTDPEYYRWTQWIFLKLYDAWYNSKKGRAEHIDTLIASFPKNEWTSKSEKEKQDILMKYRLAYEGYSEVNWCPGLGTVLANDEIVQDKDGRPVSERGGFPVEKKSMRQWFMRITAYGDRLLEGLDTLEWSEHIKEIQRNWIGKSEGSEIEFALKIGSKNTAQKIKIFTTRADTLFGVTYMVLAPEHELVQSLRSSIQNWNEVSTYVQKIKNKADFERTAADKEKTGVELKGITVINPVNGEEVPVWVADYVLASYGTGAVMAVPAHDERDLEFAKKFKLPVNYLEVEDTDESRKEITQKAGGKLVTRYKFHDAIFARQRYWGEPIPLQHDKEGIIHEVAEKDLPLKLPNVTSYQPIGTGESPLAGVLSWTKKGYETNTMPGWAGSSWYFLRYMDPHNKAAFAGELALKYWQNVDMYIGGAEHATGHLLYSRFWHMFLYDLGLVPTPEPFRRLRNQGMILGADNRKMSKRWGNIINPDDVVSTYGADTLRVYEMFIGPFGQSLPWSTESIIGSRRFIDRIWRLAEKVELKGKGKSDKNPPQKISKETEILLNKTIKKVTGDIESFSLNTSISAMMILLNAFEKVAVDENRLEVGPFSQFLRLLAPFAPHITEELWSRFGNKSSIHKAEWPRFDPTKIEAEAVSVVVQIKGKMRGSVTVSAEASESEVLEAAKSNEHIAKWLEGQAIKKIIYVKNRLINIVI
ncbi:MAG: class I tRNA ligase family protein [Candidatus Pacebacteria bacterium]|nr:class I tRNA ligase family protein [Candidatus Paceibacterota bacterium]